MNGNVKGATRILHARGLRSPSGGQCSSWRNIDPAVTPRRKFSSDWHPGTGHMPFAVLRLLAHVADWRHACVRLPRMHAAGILNEQSYYILFNWKCGFSDLFVIFLDASLFLNIDESFTAL